MTKSEFTVKLMIWTLVDVKFNGDHWLTARVELQGTFKSVSIQMYSYTKTPWTEINLRELGRRLVYEFLIEEGGIKDAYNIQEYSGKSTAGLQCII